MDEEQTVPTTYVLPNKEFLEIADGDTLPEIGDGIYTGGVAYRVTDLWFIDDDDAPLPYGFNVFLTEAPKGGNTLREFDPIFFA